MSFGMRIWGADEVLQFDTSTFTYKIIINEVVNSTGWPANTTKTYSAPGCTAENSFAVTIPILNSGDEDTPQNRQLECAMGNGVAYVRNFVQGETVGTYSTSTMRLIVARYK